jgi:hypothetical protein
MVPPTAQTEKPHTCCPVRGSDCRLLLAPIDTAVVVRELDAATIRIIEIEAFREGCVIDGTANLAAKSAGTVKYVIET